MENEYRLICRATDQLSTVLYLIKVLHLVAIGEPRLFVVARLDDKHLVVCEHLRESVGTDLAHLDVELVHLQLLLVAMKTAVLIAAGIVSRLQLMRKSNSIAYKYTRTGKWGKKNGEDEEGTR